MGVLLIQNVINAAGGIAEADLKFAYECLNASAEEFVRLVKALWGQATVTTVEGQQAYDLPADFIEPAYRNRSNRFVGKYSDGSPRFWPVLVEAEEIFQTTLTDPKEVPRRFAVMDGGQDEARLTGAATADGPEANGEAILTDASATFTASVQAGDAIFNTADEAEGYVLSVTDDTRLIAALFNGEDNGFGNGDGYVIVPAPKKQVIFEAPSMTAGHTFILPYLRKPAPVYSKFGRFPFSAEATLAICYGAAVRFLSDDETSEKKTRHLRGLFTEGVNQAKAERALGILASRRDPNRR